MFASSSSIYGDVKAFPEKETFLPLPISPYALTKLAGEHYCRMFSEQYKLPTLSLRYFNVFGPRQALDDEYAVVIPKFITCLLNNQAPPIYGNGRQSRDFTYVGNVVDANLLAVKKSNLAAGVFNVAGGRDYSILDLVKILNHILKKDIKPVFLAKRRGDVFKTKASLAKSRKLLGYDAGVSFIEGLKLTVEYFSKNE